MTSAQAVIQKVLSLPPDKLERVLEYARRIEQEPTRPRSRRLVDPLGTARDLNCDVSLEEFQRNRAWMWGSSSDKELS